MGCFYTNLTVKGPKHDAIVAWLRKADESALVAPELNGCVVVYDTRFSGFQGLGAKLSLELDAVTFAVLVHDDDVFQYELHMNGLKMDEYVSDPGVLGGKAARKPLGGHAETLCNTFGVPSVHKEVSIVLRRPPKQGPYQLEHERHADLARLLRLPPIAVAHGYGYIMDGDLPEGLSRQDLIRTGPKVDGGPFGL